MEKIRNGILNMNKRKNKIRIGQKNILKYFFDQFIEKQYFKKRIENLILQNTS